MFGLFAAAATFVATAGQIVGPVTVRPSTPEELAWIASLSPAETGDWRLVSDTPGSAVGIDVANIERQGANRVVWLARTAANADALLAYSLMKLELDCSAGRARPLWFEALTASGATVAGFRPEDGFLPYEAASGGARFAAVACDGESLPGPGLPTHQAFAAANPR